MNTLLLVALYRPYQELEDLIKSGIGYGYRGEISQEDFNMLEENNVAEYKLDKVKCFIETNHIPHNDYDFIFDDDWDCDACDEYDNYLGIGR